MIGFKKTATVVLLAGLHFTGTSQASLVARTGGMVYDDVNNITWASDANLFQTQAAGNANLVTEIIAGNGGIILNTPNDYNPSGTYTLTTADFTTTTGKMTWWGAQAWANNLTLGGVTGWILPTTVSADKQTGSQMGDLFYKQLGGVADNSIATTHNDNYNLFTNVQSYYWSGSEYAPYPGSAWYYYITNGVQSSGGKVSNNQYAWAVHSGDVAAVPVPGAVWLFGSGLIGLLSFTRKKK